MQNRFMISFDYLSYLFFFHLSNIFTFYLFTLFKHNTQTISSVIFNFFFRNLFYILIMKTVLTGDRIYMLLKPLKLGVSIL
jgi:hypothetical protein